MGAPPASPRRGTPSRCGPLEKGEHAQKGGSQRLLKADPRPNGRRGVTRGQAPKQQREAKRMVASFMGVGLPGHRRAHPKGFAVTLEAQMWAGKPLVLLRGGPLRFHPLLCHLNLLFFNNLNNSTKRATDTIFCAQLDQDRLRKNSCHPKTVHA